MMDEPFSNMIKNSMIRKICNHNGIALYYTKLFKYKKFIVLQFWLILITARSFDPYLVWF